MYPTGQNKLCINSLKLFTKSKRKRNTKDYFSLWEQRTHAGSLSLPPLLDSLLLVMTQSVPVVFWSVGLPMLHKRFHWSPSHFCSLWQIHQGKQNNYRHMFIWLLSLLPFSLYQSSKSSPALEQSVINKDLATARALLKPLKPRWLLGKRNQVRFSSAAKRKKKSLLKLCEIFFYPIPMQDNRVRLQHCWEMACQKLVCHDE